MPGSWRPLLWQADGAQRAMKRRFGLSLVIVITALAANLLLSSQTLAVYRECCFQMQPPACTHCRPETPSQGTSLSRSCCSPIQTHSGPRLAVPVPVQSQSGAQFTAMLPTPIPFVAGVENASRPSLLYGTSPPATAEILTLHSRLNI